MKAKVTLYIIQISLKSLVSGATTVTLFIVVGRKHFQSFQDRRIRVNEEDKSVVKKARTDGNLHEVLLDR